MWAVSHRKPSSFYDLFERKGGDLEVTHYCPGCGHGVLTKLIAEAIVDLGIQDRAVLVNPVGCGVFGYYYLDVGNIQAAHGRAPAVGTGLKRVRPESIVICYQGDGDLAAIGGNEILHTANRGENITVFFVNNGIYGMTGGQMAPTTPLGKKTTTSPLGRRHNVEGYPVRMCELLSTLAAPAYIERVALTDPKNHMKARKAVRKALQNQVEGRGFSFVEVLSGCPTNWRLTPNDAITWVEKQMVPTFPLGVFVDRGPADFPEPIEERGVLGEASAPEPSVELNPVPGALARGEMPSLAMKVSGFGGQGALFTGLALAEAGLKEGLQVSWIPSYGPEMRGGTAHCHVRASLNSIASPLINRPSAVIAFNEPSAEKFGRELLPGGLMVVNSSMVEHVPDRKDITIVRVPATEAAGTIGNPKVANMVILGAYLAITQAMDPESVLAALADHGLSARVLEANRTALNAGRDLV